MDLGLSFVVFLSCDNILLRGSRNILRTTKRNVSVVTRASRRQLNFHFSVDLTSHADFVTFGQFFMLICLLAAA